MVENIWGERFAHPKFFWNFSSYRISWLLKKGKTLSASLVLRNAGSKLHGLSKLCAQAGKPVLLLFCAKS